MYKGNLQLKTPFTVRASQEEIKFLNEIGSELNPNFDESTTAREFVFWLANRMTSQVKQVIPPPAATEEIQLLNNEIGRLKTLLDLTQKDLQEIKEEAIVLKARAQAAEAKAEQAQAAGLSLQENQSVITYAPIVARILDLEVEAAKKKTGKDFTREDLLTGLYWEAVKVGRAYPYRSWDRSELSALARQLKEGKEQGDE